MDTKKIEKENGLSSEKFNKGEKYSDSLKFARRCISFKEFQEMQDDAAEPELGNDGNNVEPKNSK